MALGAGGWLLFLVLMLLRDKQPGSQHWAQTPPSLPQSSPERPQHAEPYFLAFESRPLFFMQNFRLFIHSPGPLSWSRARELVSGLQVPLVNCGIGVSAVPLIPPGCHRCEWFASGKSLHSPLPPLPSPIASLLGI